MRKVGRTREILSLRPKATVMPFGAQRFVMDPITQTKKKRTRIYKQYPPFPIRSATAN
jgi:hypothetical protein